MAVELAIDDGNPWYLSPDIWVVPGADPNGAPGVPAVGQPAYLWARVHNRGTTAVTGATVRFYWANPSTVITPSTASLVGTSYVTLAPGEDREVLCLTPWLPTWVNDGHECLIATASAPSDPMPTLGPPDPFTPVSDRHQAQRNLDIVQAFAHFAAMSFTAFNPSAHRSEVVAIVARREKVDLVADIPGFQKLEKGELDKVEFGLTLAGRGEGEIGPERLELVARPGTGELLTLVARAAGRGAALILVEQLVNEEVVGGLGVVLTSDPERERWQEARRGR